MYVLIKDNFLVMNLYLEYMYGFIDIENWWIIIIDILYCCVLFYVVVGIFYCVFVIIYVLIYGIVRLFIYV